ncbi:hypothetical protein UCRPA7_6063 [Phaeoacremonium minimum UCRPA7]|uniref:Arrestin-like N-terminal domain-containing protein n=1 Tax=Phaeoacremonium minimum (strain UCR-PA7) TaxID=1286976 RepID=R8BGK0_PHAM7|nr:hypothetical protein UCRPA7_6063 [Phaeoacremonium minimum UCRPA7]EON98414.1 hypothetical protein UCRPA7_6063 [Phaeoacremonium minimum UCRPA7]
MTVSNGQNKSVYRGRFTLFETHEKLFEGPIHVPPDGEPQVWPFAIAVPKGPSPRLVSSGNEQKYSNLSLKLEDIEKQSLPPAFYYAGDSWGKKFHGYVEYYLEAEIRLSGSGSPAGTATLPIFVRPPSSPIPITDFDLKGRSFGGLIKSQRLVPGMETTELSFKQKTQKFFGSSKVPEFIYSLEIDYPTVIQLGNPNTIPFKIRLLPNRSRTSDIIEDVPQKVTLTKLTMELKANTAVRCAGTFSSHDADKTAKHPIHLAQVMVGVGSIVVPSSVDEEAIDLGALLDLRLDARRPYTMGRQLSPFQNRLAPSFTTYNIRHSYRLKWEVTISIAGESTSLSGEYPVSILAPSEEQEIEAHNALTPEEKRKKFEEVLEAANLGVAGASAILDIIQAASG